MSSSPAHPPVPFFRHDLNASAADAVGAVLSGPFLTSGQVGRVVEDQLRTLFTVPTAALTNSWTGGALATFLAWDIGDGDEVIVPAQTFVASANVVELLGARAVFCDVDPDTLLMTPETMAWALSPRTRAIMPVHLYGQMADVEALRAALDEAGRSDVLIFEDAAHCFEGALRGDRPGTHGDAAGFSFYATKNITCGEGGAVISRHADLQAVLAQTRLHGMSAAALDRFKTGGYRHWDVERLGVKANLPDLLAALLPAQIEQVDERRVRRAEIDAAYRVAFADLDVRTPVLLDDAVHAHHLFTLDVGRERRDPILTRLAEAGVGATVNYRAVPTLSLYQAARHDHPEGWPVSERWGDGVIALPLYPSLTMTEQDRVIAVVREALRTLAKDAVLGRAA